ncbi:hypothetical protein AOZ06_38095 [Kibdelosporangium phytohabitans]|uniref:Uncharacterized protein n=1 Tax=Kibdelosporangium phytohabitans TaxID=860235 RepID=A0A0N9I2H9_9PSEU|nr:hypothetical protein AOZ06_38095 [Kibdelosporangium phytohabitans]
MATPAARAASRSACVLPTNRLASAGTALVRIAALTRSGAGGTSARSAGPERPARYHTYCSRLCITRNERIAAVATRPTTVILTPAAASVSNPSSTPGVLRAASSTPCSTRVNWSCTARSVAGPIVAA